MRVVAVRTLHVEVESLSKRKGVTIVDRVRLAAHILLPRIGAGLASSAGRLLATESAANLGAIRGNVNVGDTSVGASRASPLHNVGNVLSEHGRGEPLLGVVVQSDGLLNSLELHGVGDRNKSLLADDGGGVLNFDKSRLDIILGGGVNLTLATDENLAALLLRGRDRSLKLLDSVEGVEGANEDALLEGVANLQLLVKRSHLGDDGIVEGLVNVKSAACGAPLAGGTSGAEEGGANGHLDISIVHDEDSIVSAKLEKGLTEAGRDALIDVAPDVGGASEGDEGDVTGLDNNLANVSAASNEGADGAGELVSEENIGDDFLRGDGDEGGGGGALPNLGVASDHRDGGVPSSDGDGEVERADDTNGAKGVPLLHHEVVGALGRKHLAGDLAGETSSKVAHINILLDLADTLGEDLADLEREELAEGLNLLAELITNLADNLATAGGGDLSPHGLSLVHVLDATGGILGGGDLHHRAELLAGDGGVGLGESARGLPLLTVVATGVSVLNAELLEERVLGGDGGGEGLGSEGAAEHCCI